MSEVKGQTCIMKIKSVTVYSLLLIKRRHLLHRHLVALSFSPPGLVSLICVIDPDSEYAIRATQRFLHHDRYLPYSA